MTSAVPWRVGLSIALLVAACSMGSPVIRDGVTLLRYGFLTGGPTAQEQGRLRVANGCVWIEPIFLGQVQPRELLAWPSSAELDASSGHIRVVLNGTSFGDGDELTVGGGEFVDRDHLEGLVGPPPAGCVSDSWWLVTDAYPGLLIKEAL